MSQHTIYSNFNAIHSHALRVAIKLLGGSEMDDLTLFSVQSSQEFRRWPYEIHMDHSVAPKHAQSQHETSWTQYGDWMSLQSW